MDGLHEAVKVHTHLALTGQAVEKKIHHVGLATPDTAPEIQALQIGRPPRSPELAAEKGCQETWRAIPVINQAMVKLVQLTDGVFLGPVGLDFSFG